MATVPDALGDYPTAGWGIAGFSTSFSEAGIIFHTVLVQKEASIVAITIGMNRSEEVFRTVAVLARQSIPPKARGSPRSQ